mmetsp:Transcript_1280/g.2111  ORF Transcript_1280/g.2111 Transcript_1280/m.2111 type:complete len:1146 (-) Transcript_1280:162-3599(-)|eukprot:CAMPEP_0174966870 /NCGR_PEP_ID=MMETSP0004_2-20121128/7272_1 /TAXON_ID=420556 /ORGANISM="Ochromonas sp., Strain CCMP1393" /LENGTH=1145 /DNA_ID=CAMNT_0016215947 /DNA_START=87 /DNA_END=3524 /DNA_ORIENTATION=-
MSLLSDPLDVVFATLYISILLSNLIRPLVCIQCSLSSSLSRLQVAACLIAFGISLPYLLELLIDWYIHSSLKTSSIVDKGFLSFLRRQMTKRVMFLPSLIVHGGLFLPSINILRCLANLLAYTGFAQTLTIAAVVAKFQEIKAEVWTRSRSCCILLLFTISRITLSEAVARDENEDWLLYPSLFALLGCMGLIAHTARSHMLQTSVKVSSSSESDSADSGSKNDKEEHQLVMAVMSATLLFCFALAVTTMIYMGDAVTEQELLSEGIISHVIFVVFSMILASKVVQQDLIHYQSQIDAEKSYVRYISHEIRSPISVTSQGIDYLLQNLRISMRNSLKVRMPPDTSLTQAHGSIPCVRTTKETEVNSTCTAETPGPVASQETDNTSLGMPAQSDRVHYVGSATMTMSELLDVLEDCQQSCAAATSTLNDLLLYDKIRTDMIEIFPEPVMALKLVIQTAKPFRLQARSKNIHLRMVANDAQSRKLYVLFDHPKMEQVLRNFLTNAVKFTPANGTITVQMKLLTEFSEENGNKNGKKGSGDRNDDGDEDEDKGSRHQGRGLMRELSGVSLRISLPKRRNSFSIDVDSAGDDTNSSADGAGADSADEEDSISSMPLRGPRLHEPARPNATTGNASTGNAPSTPFSSQEVSESSGILRVEVKDSGAGISKENLPKLFGQYVQFDPNILQSGGGSGLGLWLSKAIVELHGGRIGATSDGEGCGTTFYFELPYGDHSSSKRSDHSDDQSAKVSETLLKFLEPAGGAGTGTGTGNGIVDGRRELGKGADQRKEDQVSSSAGTAAAAAAGGGGGGGHYTSPNSPRRDSRTTANICTPSNSQRFTSTATTTNDNNNDNRHSSSSSERPSNGEGSREYSTASAVSEEHSMSAAVIKEFVSRGEKGPNHKNKNKKVREKEKSELRSLLSQFFDGGDEWLAIERELEDCCVSPQSSKPPASDTARQQHQQQQYQRQQHQRQQQQLSVSVVPAGIEEGVIDQQASESTAATAVTPAVVGTKHSKKHHDNHASEKKRRFKILIADDAPLARKMLQRMMSTFTRDCQFATTGLQAVDMVKASMLLDDPFDVVITDLNMPEMNGDAAIRYMRAAGYRGVIIAATGSAAEEDRGLIMRSGGDAVLVKPLTLKDISYILHEMFY